MAPAALPLRTYSRRVILLPLGPKDVLTCEQRRTLSEAAIATPEAPVADVCIEGARVAAVLTNGAHVTLDVLYPAMGVRVRSDLAIALGAHCTEQGCVFVDDHQRTSVPGLYAAGDITIRSASPPARRQLRQLTSTTACRRIRVSRGGFRRH